MRDAGKAIFYLTYHKNLTASEDPPEPRWGSSRHSPRPPSRVGRAPFLTPSSSAPLAPRSLEGVESAYSIYLSGPSFLKS